VTIHADRESLEDHHIPISVGNDARETIAFAPDQASQILTATHALPVFQGLLDAPLEKVQIQILPMPREAPDDNL
jgi:hypothetical protein